jgi:hypothetical protein
MGRSRWIAVGVVSVFLLAFAFLGMGSFNKVKAQTADASDEYDELQPPSPPLERHRARALPAPSSPLLVPRALPAPTPGETLAYFFPTDNDATATVMFLLNTDSIAHIVALRGYSQNGVLVYSLNINIGATSMLRLASDSIASAPPPSWATSPLPCPSPACEPPIITNFTDFTYFASISLPKGVKVDGYTLFNPGTGVVDPRQDQGAMPLRFMTSPFYLP